MHRKITTLLLVMLMFALCVSSAFADTQDDGRIFFKIKNGGSVKTSLNITKGTAYVNVKVRDVDKKSTKLETTAYLQKKSGKKWIKVTSWSASNKSYTLILSKSKKISKGTYRVKSVSKVWNGKSSETITDHSQERSY